jgi:uncharacterized protein
MGQHPIVHIEIPVSNPEEDGKFYAELFGWDVKTMAMPDMSYTMFSAGDGPGGGLPKIDGEMNKANEPLVYVGTDDVTATLEAAAGLGSTVILPKMEIPGVGYMGIFIGPSGNRIGLYQDGV